MGRRYVINAGKLPNSGIALVHAKWNEDTLAHHVVPLFAQHRRLNLPGGEIHDVLIAKARTHAPRRFEKTNATQYLVAIVGRRIPKQIAAFEPAAMRYQIADSHLACSIRIEELKSRQVFR